MLIEKWDPFKDFERLHNEVERAFSDFPFGWKRRKDWLEKPEEGKIWVPAVDIYEDEEQVVLKAEIPGIEEKNIDIKLEGNVLTMKGERKFEHEEKKKNWTRIERAYGTFQRSFSLPEYVDTEKVSAEYKNGILSIFLPKKPETKTKQIKVEIKK